MPESVCVFTQAGPEADLREIVFGLATTGGSMDTFDPAAPVSYVLREEAKYNSDGWASHGRSIR